MISVEDTLFALNVTRGARSTDLVRNRADGFGVGTGGLIDLALLTFEYYTI
jgi:hypothetical protein